MSGEDARNHLINAMPGRLNLDNLPADAWTAMPRQA
jgi:hypothetical protein